MNKKTAKMKKEALIKDLKRLRTLMVAFSGGVDSTFLLAVAQEALGDGVVAVTAKSASYPLREIDEASAFARQRGIEHIIFDSEETSLPGFIENSPDRCYHCKKSLSEELIEIAGRKGMTNIAYASNLDDQ
jgi:uncharacterized protein